MKSDEEAQKAAICLLKELTKAVNALTRLLNAQASRWESITRELERREETK